MSCHPFWKKSFNWFVSSLFSSGFKTSKLLICFFPCSSIAFVCFSKAFNKREYANLFVLDGNISSPVRYLYLQILPDDNADIFYASLLISYCNFSSLILSSVVMISFYTVSTRFFLKRKRLSDARIVYKRKEKNMIFQYTFYKDS